MERPVGPGAYRRPVVRRPPEKGRQITGRRPTAPYMKTRINACGVRARQRTAGRGWDRGGEGSRCGAGCSQAASTAACARRLVTSQVISRRNSAKAISARCRASSGRARMRRHCTAKSSGASAGRSSRPWATSWPYAPSGVDTSGHLRLNASAILMRVPPAPAGSEHLLQGRDDVPGPQGGPGRDPRGVGRSDEVDASHAAPVRAEAANSRLHPGCPRLRPRHCSPGRRSAPGRQRSPRCGKAWCTRAGTVGTAPG